MNSYNDKTEDWRLYEAGKQYNNRLEPNYYDTVDANYEFFHGNQWRNVKAENIPKPTFNIIKRITQFLVASLTSSKIKLHFEPLPFFQQPTEEGQLNSADIANAQTTSLFEKFKMDFKIKEALFDAAITGDSCAHFFFDVTKQPYGSLSEVRGEIGFELVDGSNVFFGNANNSNVESQPYIIVSGRDMVRNLKEQAKRYKQKDSEVNSITNDYNYHEQTSDSGKIEVEADEYGKALYIIVYKKKKVKRAKKDEQGNEMFDVSGNPVTEEVETIVASKSVENAYIFKDVDTGLSHYPVAWLNWEKQKNQYHGRALCTGILPNQIFINRMFAMVMYHLQMTAFPKTVYNADVITSWSNEIGQAIAVRGLGTNENIKNIAGYLEPGNMSNRIESVIDLAMQYTKETLGISDAALGNVDPKNTSAIIAVQKSTAIPLENPKSNLYEWVEDIGKILLDFMGTYYGIRPVPVDQNGEKVVVEYDFNQFKDLFLDIRADVGESSYWSEIASIQTLDNLLGNGHIDIIEYLERTPDEYIPQKEELISSIKERMQQQVMNPEQLVSQLPPEEQAAFMNAPPEVQQQILAQIQQQPQAPPQGAM
ncbi:portal protein [Cytobacillus sp. FSL H8-0458]|uniref:portal protein n=1 Tax=Cytobacillus sp. FSL H8-0458 TaxID=2975346 RepID=UPI0030F7AB1E